MRRACQSDLSDAEWACLQPHLPIPDAPGRPGLHTLREITDAIFYVVRGGCAWRLLPHDFPPWKTVYHYFRSWRLDGTWERMHSALRKRVRVRMDRDPKPAPEEMMMRWAREWAKEGVSMDPTKFLPPEEPRTFLPRRWVVERTFSWSGQNRRMSKDYERLPETGETLIYAAMSRLMARRLARS
jgi:transposase